MPAILLLVLLSACGSALTPTSTLAPAPTAVPRPVVTGLPEVDAVIDAVARADHQALLGLVQYETLGCGAVEGLGGPPRCRSGETDGELVQAFYLQGPEGVYLRPDETGPMFQELESYRLYAVYRADYNGLAHMVVFSDPDTLWAMSLLVQNGIRRAYSHQLAELPFNPPPDAFVLAVE